MLYVNPYVLNTFKLDGVGWVFLCYWVCLFVVICCCCLFVFFLFFFLVVFFCVMFLN